MDSAELETTESHTSFEDESKANNTSKEPTGNSHDLEGSNANQMDEQTNPNELDLDLYADVESNEFNNNNNPKQNSGGASNQHESEEITTNPNPNQIEIDVNINEEGVIDETGLYDDVMAAPTPTNISSEFNSDMAHFEEANKALQKSEQTQSTSANSFQTNQTQYTKRVSCYIGNLTWWTTDKDLSEAIQGLGCSDLIDIKFYENKINGQSKGFALVTFGSDQTFRTLMDKLSKKQINGQEPVVTPFSRHYFNQFEEQARKDMPQSAGGANNPDTGGLNDNFHTNNSARSQATGPRYSDSQSSHFHHSSHQAPHHHTSQPNQFNLSMLLINYLFKFFII